MESKDSSLIHVVGVDGGTTKTIALVANDRGQILGVGRSGNSNWLGPNVEKPMAVVVDAVEQALTMAGLSGDDVALGVFGLAGADWPEDHERREAVLSRRGIAQEVVVKNDALVGWRASTRQTFGAVIAAGTGTNTCVITPDGREWCYGYYADNGGAWDVAHSAIRAVLRAEDGRGQPTALTGIVLKKLGYATPQALLRASYTGQLDREAVLSLCPLVFQAADAGDEAAAEIIVRQGQVLAEYATAAIRRFEMEDLAFDVVLSGSVFKGQGPLLIDTVTQAVHRVAPHTRIVPAAFEPAIGSILLAYDQLGIVATDKMLDRLVRTMPDHAFFSTLDGRGVGQDFGRYDRG